MTIHEASCHTSQQYDKIVVKILL